MKRLLTTTAMLMLLSAAPAFADNHNNALGGARPGGTGHTNEGYTNRGVTSAIRRLERGYWQGNTFIPSGNFTSRHQSSGGGPRSKGVGDKTGHTSQMNDKSRL